MPTHPHTPRRQLRVEYGRDMVVRLDNGSILSGIVSNFSANGFFLACPPDRIALCQPGRGGALLTEEIPGETLELPCRVVRMDAHGVAFAFLDHSPP